MFTYAKISPKMVNPRDIAGNAEEEEVSCGKELVVGIFQQVSFGGCAM